MPVARLSDLHRTAFVTGASTGLGRAFTDMLLAEGVRVWGTTREPQRLTDLEEASAKNSGDRKFTAVKLDLHHGAEAEAIFRESDHAAGGFDLVINNAGFGVFGEFVAAEFNVWQEQLEVMLINTARLSHAALRGMVARHRGALVNISSLAAEFPLPFQSAYNISKAGLTALNESLMIEVAGTGVIVLDVRPGDYRTDFDRSVRKVSNQPHARLQRAWGAFETMMKTGPLPVHAAAALRRALLKNRSATVRTGRLFQAVIAPLIARFGSLPLRRRIEARYHGL